MTATFSRDCLLHLSFVMVISMIISLTRINHVHHHCQPLAKGKLKLGTKSDIVRCLEDGTEEQDDITPSADVVMLDGPAMLCVLKPEACSLRNYARLRMTRMCSSPMWNINWVKYTELTSCGTTTDQIL